MHTPHTDLSVSPPSTEWWPGAGDDVGEDRCDRCACLDEGGADLDNFADLNLGANLDADSEDDRRAIFTGSGNHFVFDDIDDERAKNNYSPANEDVADAPAVRTQGGSASVSVAARSAQQQKVPAAPLHNSAQSAVTAQQQQSLPPQPAEQALSAQEVTMFIDSFKREGRSLPSAIATLQTMVQNFPKLVYLVRNAAGVVEVHFLRDALIKKLREEEHKFPNIVFTSFERGLKHAGMEVTQSTHGQILVKKWARKRGFVPKHAAAVAAPPLLVASPAAGAAKIRRSRKRKDQSDDDFVESDKKKKVRSAAARFAPRPNNSASEPVAPLLPQLHLSASSASLLSLVPEVPPPALPRLFGDNRTSSEG